MSKVKIKIENGKIVENRQEIADMFTSSNDGVFFITKEPENQLITPRDCQKLYFDKIDACVLHTGYKRYEIHEQFKQFQNISTTRDLSVERWKEILQQFSWWAFNQFDFIV